MPLPVPKSNEPIGLFNNRCMSDNNEKRIQIISTEIAVCKSQWEKSKMETISSLKNG